jgi:hypothetical protein
VITFTLQEFLDMIAHYNTTFWPMAIVTYALGLVAVISAFSNRSYASRLIAGVLAFFWLWVGIVFNGLVFSELSNSSIAFAVLFVIQGLLLALAGIYRRDLSFSVKADVYGLVGSLAILYGMVGYPALELLLGRGYPQALLLGLVPCPTISFTLGMLLWSDRPLPKGLLVIPVLYALSGGALAVSQGIVEDMGMIALALIAASMILYRERATEPTLRLGGEGGA